eukprot:8419696-Alexandrium_andersonii.AAC.1
MAGLGSTLADQARPGAPTLLRTRAHAHPTQPPYSVANELGEAKHSQKQAVAATRQTGAPAIRPTRKERSPRPGAVTTCDARGWRRWAPAKTTPKPNPPCRWRPSCALK